MGIEIGTEIDFDPHNDSDFHFDGLDVLRVLKF